MRRDLPRVIGPRSCGGWWIPLVTAIIGAGGAIYSARKQSKAQKEALAYQEKVRTEEDAKIKKAQEENAKAATEAAAQLNAQLGAQILESRDQPKTQNALQAFMTPPVLIVSFASLALVFFLRK